MGGHVLVLFILFQKAPNAGIILKIQLRDVIVVNLQRLTKPQKLRKPVNSWIITSGMKIRDGFLKMANQNHLLEDARRMLPPIGRDLWKAVGTGI